MSVRPERDVGAAYLALEGLRPLQHGVHRLQGLVLRYSAGLRLAGEVRCGRLQCPELLLYVLLGRPEDLAVVLVRNLPGDAL